jgi:hypothetical protein
MPTTPPSGLTPAHVLSKFDAGEDLSLDEVSQCRVAGAGWLTAFMEALPKHPPEMRKVGLELISQLGSPELSAHPGEPARIAPYIRDPGVVKYLVRALTDEDRAVRKEASGMLARQVTAELLRDDTEEILKAVRHRPGLTDGALLLGRVGSHQAAMLLRSDRELKEASPEDTDCALARLGDWGAEDRMLARYEEAKTHQEKKRYFLFLGCMATPRALLTLARAIRTPESYMWNMRSRRSMRVHVIEGLHLAFLTEPLFWAPWTKPSNDEYYQEIETWLVRHLGVDWKEPRPPFLYEEDAPTPAPRPAH